MARTTVHEMCMTCDRRTPHESDNEGGKLARKQVELWKQANGWRGLPPTPGRRAHGVAICAACVAEIVALTKTPPTLEEQS
jgi:hypothetical protein